MPSVQIKVCWPDESTTDHTSPSTIIKDYFQADDELSVDMFVEQAEKAFQHASERVKERFGFYCSMASDSLADIQRHAGKQPEGQVRIIDLKVMK